METLVAPPGELVKLWTAPDTSLIALSPNAEVIRYGRELITRTSYYLGPNGKVKPISNGMNCQNCHLDAGTRPFGNNYGSVSSTYPKLRARSGTTESIERRVNDCIMRSLNGVALDSLSAEMRAIVAYMHWLGQDVPKNRPAAGSGLSRLTWLDRAADPKAGLALYSKHCVSCHGNDGAGKQLADGTNLYPPLWGDKSFNTGAGLLRISNFASYIYTNMPVGATYSAPILTLEEAWDIAAYVIRQPRPVKHFAADWPRLESKPVDHPFGPYADSFSETQHTFGPFVEIIEAGKK